MDLLHRGEYKSDGAVLGRLVIVTVALQWQARFLAHIGALRGTRCDRRRGITLEGSRENVVVRIGQVDAPFFAGSDDRRKGIVAVVGQMIYRLDIVPVLQDVDGPGKIEPGLRLVVGSQNIMLQLQRA